MKINYLLGTAWEKARTRPALSLILLDTLQTIYRNNRIDYKKDVMYYYYGIVHKNLSNYSLSQSYFDQYFQFHKKLGNNRHLAVVNMALANLNSDRSMWSESMSAVTKALELYESLKDTTGIIRASSKLGFLLLQLKRYRDAQVYHNRSYQLSVALSDTTEQSIAYSNLGLVYEKLNLPDSALWYYEHAYMIDTQQQNKWGLVYINGQIGRLLYNLENYSDALPYAKNGYQLALDLEAPNLITQSQLLYGSVLIKNGMRKKGIYLLQHIILDTSLNQALLELAQAHEVLYESFKESGDLDKSLLHLERFHILSDSLLNTEIAEQINGLEFKYDAKNKEMQIALLNSDRELSTARLKASRTRIYTLLTAMIITTGLLVGIVFLYRKTRMQNAVISKALKEKDTLLREIHHRVKNNLQFISSLLNLQARHVEDPRALDVLKEGQNRVKSMALIHQNLYQKENIASIGVKTYFEKLITSIYRSYNIDENQIQFELDIESILLDVDSIVPIGLIVNELVSNALKHAFPEGRSGIVKISLREKDDALYLDVSDNGIGFEESTENIMNKSFGYKLINTFRSQLDADLILDGSDGTSVSLKIRDYMKVA